MALLASSGLDSMQNGKRYGIERVFERSAGLGVFSSFEDISRYMGLNDSWKVFHSEGKDSFKLIHISCHFTSMGSVSPLKRLVNASQLPHL